MGFEHPLDECRSQGLCSMWRVKGFDNKRFSVRDTLGAHSRYGSIYTYVYNTPHATFINNTQQCRSILTVEKKNATSRVVEDLSI